MADEPKQPPQGPTARPGAGEPKQSQPAAPEGEPKPGREDNPKADAPASAKVSGKTRDIVTPKDVLGPVSPTRAEAIRKGREAGRRSGAPVLPTAPELDRIRDEYFGGKPGTVRVDAPPEGGGPDAPPTRLVFFDADGRRAGERDYRGPEDED